MKITFAILCFLTLFTLQAQTIKLINKTTLQGVENVQIYNEEEPALTIRSDAKGYAKLTGLKRTGTFVFRHGYYNTIKMEASELKGQFLISLSEKISEYDDVVISANRFEEKKGDVVQKIQVIRSNDLEVMNQTSTADFLA